MKRRVGRGIWDVQEEWAILLAPDVADSLLGSQIREISLAPDWLAVRIEVVISSGVEVVKVIHAAANTVKGMVEAVLLGAKLWFVTEVPLSGDGGGVAGVLEHARDRVFCSR